MKSIDLDIALVLPESMRRQAVACSEFLATQIAAAGSSSHFQLGKPLADNCHENCEPHVSLFMLTVDNPEIVGVVRTVGQIAKTLPTLTATGKEYRHNPHGAPELYFTKSTAWKNLQRAVVTSVEPLRRGRLREMEPSGSRIKDILDSAAQNWPGRQQILKYGYDEIADDSNGGHDRFNPHVTFAWPHDTNLRVPLAGLPPVHAFDGVLSELAVFGMRGYGTCTKNYDVFPLQHT